MILLLQRETMKPLQKTAAPKITLFTDGSLRKGDQAATWAFIMKTNSGEVLYKEKGVIPGTAQLRVFFLLKNVK